jgi:hypothetical protein
MTTLTKEVQKTSAQVRKWEAGKTYRCILSKSPGYKEGVLYKAYKNADGVVCLEGSDGFEDMCYMLVSGFVEVKSS